jgi:hypothetical protein
MSAVAKKIDHSSEPITREWLDSVGTKVFKVYPAQLLVTPEMQSRMKELSKQHEVAYFPDSAWHEDQFQRIAVDRVKDGRLCVVNTDTNLLKLLRWTHPLGLNLPKVPVSIATAAVAAAGK